MSFGLGFRLFLNFPGRIALVLGVCQAVLGILDIVLAVAGFIQRIWGHYYATGIWCGVIVFIDGLCGILASQTRNGFGVKTFFALSTLSTMVTFIMIILSFGGLDFRSSFYDRAYQFTGQKDQATKAIHGSLLALGLVEFIVSIINTAMCLKPKCYEKSEWTYTQKTAKPPETSGLDIPRGVVGGNPDCLPASEQPMLRRYRSPRRQQNGTGNLSNETYNEVGETSEFLPKQPQYTKEDRVERGSGTQTRRSRDSENARHKSFERERNSQGRVYGRQSDRRRSEGNQGRSAHNPTSQNYESSTVPKRKCRENRTRSTQNDTAVVVSERRTMPYSARDEGGMTSERRDRRKDRQYSAPSQSVGFTTDSSWERRQEERRSDQGRRSDSSEKIASHLHNREGMNHEPERNNSFRGNPMSERPSPSDIPQAGGSLNRQDSDRTHSMEMGHSSRRPGSEKVERPIRTSSYRQTQRPDNTQGSADPTSHSDVVNPAAQGEKSHVNSSQTNFGLGPKAAPLRRSVGSRGSYSAAVNLMPTESTEHLPSDQEPTVHRLEHVPPTAFGEEDLPAYEEIRLRDPHIYSSLEMTCSDPDSSRLLRLGHGGSSAEMISVSQSVADEEVQEILGTRNPTRFGSPIRSRNTTQSNTPDMTHGNIISDRAGNGTTYAAGHVEETHPADIRQLAASDRRRDTRPKRSEGRTEQRNTPDQDRYEVSLALPSPMRSSPTFTRGQHSRASDRVPELEHEDIPEIKMQKAFRASFPQRRSERERNPRRWGISVTDPRAQSASPEVKPSHVNNVKEDKALSELCASFPLLRAVGGVDFGLSDKESYMDTPDSTVYSFTYDEVKPRVFMTSPYRTPRKSSPLTGFSVPKLPSSEEEVESRTRVIETVNVGVASPPHYRRNPPKQTAMYKGDRAALRSADSTTVDNKQPETHWKPLVSANHGGLTKNSDTAKQSEETSQSRPKFFYPPERLPSKVSNDVQPVGLRQVTVEPRTVSQNVFDKPRSYEHVPTVSDRRPNRQIHPTDASKTTVPTVGSSRPEDSNIAFYAFQDVLSGRSAWERQTYPPDLADDSRQPSKPRMVGRAAQRRVMRSEQAAQEEPLQHPNYLGEGQGDVRFSSRRYAVPFAPEPSAPSVGGPPPYSEVARPLSHTHPDRAPLQPHSTGRQSGGSLTNRPDRSRDSPSLV
ncbi:uncharacterized protein LOC135473827 [Liolophura sinensis]|uniref:uncharacterized protein LOC135473827 n=1 Tax=Liolophura sinensis TaxID=3198878 RepID=UPI003158CB81